MNKQGKVSLKKKKKIWNFPYLDGGGSEEVKFHIFFFFQLGNGLKHPEMQRKIFPFVRGQGGLRTKLWKYSKYFQLFKGKNHFFFQICFKCAKTLRKPKKKKKKCKQSEPGVTTNFFLILPVYSQLFKNFQLALNRLQERLCFVKHCVDS